MLAYVFRCFIAQTFCCPTPKSAAISLWVRVSALIERICSGVSFRRRNPPFATPNLWRSLAAISSMFSLCVPRNKCSGFRHFRLSHLWQTDIPFGIGPTNLSYERRCVRKTFPPRAMFPYPSGTIWPLHSQHPFRDLSTSLSKCSQNSLSVLALSAEQQAIEHHFAVFSLPYFGWNGSPQCLQ